MLQQIVLIFHIVAAIALIAIVLVQQGKGAGMGASFGSGASQTVFGSQGSSSFLVKLDCWNRYFSVCNQFVFNPSIHCADESGTTRRSNTENSCRKRT